MRIKGWKYLGKVDAFAVFRLKALRQQRTGQRPVLMRHYLFLQAVCLR